MTWFAIAGGLAAWTAQLVGSYLLLDFGCRPDAGTAGVAAWPLLALSIGCGIVALASAVVAGRRAARARGAARALFGGGLLLDALALVTIALGAVLPLTFAPCLRA